MAIDFDGGRIRIDSPAEKSEVERFLKQYEPWRHRIDFSCGLSSASLRTIRPFNPTPTKKIQIVESQIGPLSGFKRALDVGCNAGYNSLYLAERYGMDVVGIDFSTRHISVSSGLARFAGIDRCRFIQGDAETFRDPDGFDLILHFGTLYHLKNPVRAIESALANLRPGGMLLIETQLYGWWPWETRAAFIYDQGGDKSNWWALGERSIIKICSIFGAHAERVGRRRLLRQLRWKQTRGFFKVTKDILG